MIDTSLLEPIWSRIDLAATSPVGEERKVISKYERNTGRKGILSAQLPGCAPPNFLLPDR